MIEPRGIVIVENKDLSVAATAQAAIGGDAVAAGPTSMNRMPHGVKLLIIEGLCGIPFCCNLGLVQEKVLRETGAKADPGFVHCLD